ncbi:unnamed protein product [Allacma fusca]|uniref:Uncharacterized protein n=1 Tax=Allacma fusca TaxID=39272 RepID=A0A8J2NVZ8_9HEXA|nr:unnamed protein product [Allacma fusca]
MIAVESAVYVYSDKRLPSLSIDQIYQAFALPFLVFSFAWAIYFKKEGRAFPQYTWSRFPRTTQGMILLSFAWLTPLSPQTIKNPDACDFYEFVYELPCQRLKAKVAAGVSIGLIQME